jgi:plastocyanin
MRYFGSYSSDISNFAYINLRQIALITRTDRNYYTLSQIWIILGEKMRKLGWITLLVAIPLIMAACGSQAPPEPLEMTINMSEYSFTPADLEFQVGQEVTLHLTNSGALDHEIMFGRELMMMDGMPNGFNVDMFETAGVEPDVSVEMSMETESEGEEHTEGDEHSEEEEHMEEDEHMEGDEHDEEDQMEDDHAHSGFMVQVPVSNDTYTMSFTVTEDMVGEWEIGCFLLDGVHYNSGMVGTLTVE